MGDWEDLTEMFGLDSSASWDEVAGRMGVHEHEAQSCRASYKPSLYDPVEDSRVENAPALIAAAVTTAGGWGPVRVERRSWQAEEAGASAWFTPGVWASPGICIIAIGDGLG